MGRFINSVVVHTAVAVGCTLLSAGMALAQGRGGADWLTNGGDAQRASWVRTDPRISVEALQKPGFQLIWKVKTTADARQQNGLSQSVTLSSYIGYRGFRSLAFLSGGSDNLVAIDTDLGRIEWSKHLAGGALPATSATCPGGITSGVTRAVTLPAVPGPGRPGAAPPQAGRGRATSGVGEPSQGAVTIQAGPGGGAGRGPGGASGRGAQPLNAVYAITNDGMLHSLYVSNGEGAKPPVRFLPANANAAGLMMLDNTAYVGTVGNCGGVPNGVWAIDTGTGKVVSWTSNGGGTAGSAGPVLGTDGTVYAATVDGDYSPTGYSDSVVALDGKTLQVKNFFTPGKSAFTSSPVAFPWNGRDMIAAANQDGKLYLLDSASLGGADHKTAAAVSTAYTGNAEVGALATWEQPDGTRYVLAPVRNALNAATRFPTVNGAVTNGAIAAFKVVEQGGKPTLQPAWVSRDLNMPLTPMVMNGVVFAVGGGNATTPAILYALDGSTGKDLWNSAGSITSYVRSGGLSGGPGTIYLSTMDGTVYSFGIPIVIQP